jgi:hypothetical protein
LRWPRTTWFGSETSRRPRHERPAIGAENPIQIRRGWRSASRTSISSVLRPTGRVENNNAAVICFFSSLLGHGKRWRARQREMPPFTRVGRALTHVVGFLDPLEEQRASTSSEEDARKSAIEAILRIGIFYNHEPYNHTISRYYEMFDHIAPRLAEDPDVIDVQGVFQRTTGIRLKTYLQLGVVLLATVHAIASRRDGPPLLNLRAITPPRHARKLWRRFMRQIMGSQAEYRKQHRANLSRSSLPHYNFLAAENQPLIALSKRVACCLSLTFLERRFGVGIMHRVLEQMPLRESGRFRRFFGRVFEEYVRGICGRTFGELFVPGPRYGRNLEGGDGWILYPPKAILIEAKSGSVDLDTALSGRFDGFERAFVKTILRGARQLNRVIEDFRRRRFTVGGFGPDDIRIIFPVIVGLHYLPLDKFVWNYAREQLDGALLLKQDAVRSLTIMAAKDLEQVEASGGGLLGLIEERLDQEAWRDAPFSNFLYEKRPAGGRSANAFLAERYKELLRGGAKQLFHFTLTASER